MVVELALVRPHWMPVPLLMLMVVELALVRPHWMPVPLLRPTAAFIPLRLLQKQDLNHHPLKPNLLEQLPVHWSWSLSLAEKAAPLEYRRASTMREPILAFPTVSSYLGAGPTEKSE